MRVDVQPIEQRCGRLDAGLLVIERADAAVDDRGRRRLAEVVAHRAEHHRDQPRAIEVAVQRARASSITISVCDPDVALGMPLRLLLAADERHASPAAARSMTPRSSASAKPIDGRCGLRAAASRTRPRSARPAGRRAGSRGTAPRCPSSSVSSKRAANCSARSTRRLSSPNVAGSTARRTRALEIGAAVERIHVLAGQRIPGDRVDGEVAPARGLLERHRRVARDLEALVAAAASSIRGGAARRRCRRRLVGHAQLVDGKALADGFDAAERREQRRQPSSAMPKTSRSRSFGRRWPRSRSRTQPPTTSARPPASRTARSDGRGPIAGSCASPFTRRLSRV